MATTVTPCVLQYVYERPLHLHGIDADKRHVTVDREAEVLLAGGQVGERRAQHLLDRGPRGTRLGGARFKTREVQQIVHKARETQRLLLDDRGHLVTLLL